MFCSATTLLLSQAESLAPVVVLTTLTGQGRNRYHGAVIVRIVAGRIANWREYQRRSDLDWPDFVGRNRF
jgi:hypothetical protein